MASGLFRLSINNYPDHIARGLKSIWNQGEFFDFMMVCDEDQIVHCHKVVLAAASPYFRKILRNHPWESSISLMPGDVRFSDLCCLVDLIYNGEVQLTEQDVDAVVALAHRFEIDIVREGHEEPSLSHGARRPIALLCPNCSFKSSNADGMKSHLLAAHADIYLKSEVPEAKQEESDTETEGSVHTIENTTFKDSSVEPEELQEQLAKSNADDKKRKREKSPSGNASRKNMQTAMIMNEVSSIDHPMTSSDDAMRSPAPGTSSWRDGTKDSGVASAVEDPRKKTSKRRGRNSEGQVKKPRKSSSTAEATLTASAATEEPKPPHYPSAEKSRGSGRKGRK